MTTVKQATIDLLRRLQMTTVFGNPGSTELPFLGDWPADFRYILGLQEASVVAMADGYARATGRAAFCNLHSAAGVGHGLGNIFTAYKNQAPLVISAGQQARSLLSLQPYLGATDAASFPKPYVKWSCEPARAEDVPQALAQAYHIAMQKPCGPTFVSIPMDDWNAPAEFVTPRTVSRDVGPDPTLIALLANALEQAKHPVFVVGPEVDLESAAGEAVRLAETVGAPVWVSPFSSRASFPEDHGLFAGFLPASPSAIAQALKPYDLIVVLGAPVFTFHVAGECALFRSGVSLYQLTTDGMAAAAAPIGTSILGSLALSLSALLDRLPRATAQARARRAAAPAPPPTHPPTAAYLLHLISRTRPENSIVVEEAPSHRDAMHEHLRIERPGTFFTMSSGGLGYGLPAAVGVALARPGTPVVCIIGDGSLMYSIQALWTAVREGLPLTVVVINNGGYGAMRSFSRVLNIENPPGLELPGLSYSVLAAGMGCSAVKVGQPTELAPALRAAFKSLSPRLIEVVVDQAAPKLY